MQLSSICESLSSRQTNPPDFDRILSDYISSFSVGSFELPGISDGDNLERFIELSIHPFDRFNPDDQESMSYMQKFTKFLYRIAQTSPIVQNLIGKYIPVVKIIDVISKSNECENFKNILYLCALTLNSTYPQIKTTENLGQIVKNISQILEKDFLRTPAMCLLGSMVSSNPVFLSFVRSSSELMLIRDKCTLMLSSDDHLSVVAALSCLLSIFPGNTDSNTVNSAARYAISVSNDNPLLLKFGVMLLIDPITLLSFTEDHFLELVVAASGTIGMKQYIIYDALNRILMNAANPGSIVTESFDFDLILGAGLATPYGFVSQSILKLIRQILFFRPDIFDTLKNCNSQCEQAIKILCAPSTTIDIELVECAASYLKYFVLSDVTLAKVKEIIKENSDVLFVSFQRHIEASNSYLSLVIFLFLSIASQKLGDYLEWKAKIRITLIDSQFSALLAHVLEKTTDRLCLVDAISALAQVTKYEIDDKICDHSVIFDSMISGFMAINSKNIEKDKIFQEQVTYISEKYKRENDELKAQIEFCRMEMSSLCQKADFLTLENNNYRVQVADLELKLKTISDNCTELNEIRETNSKQIEELKDEVLRLKEENGSLENKLKIQNEKIDVLTEANNTLKIKEDQLLQTERKNSAYEVEVRDMNQNMIQLQGLLDEQVRVNEGLKTKIRDLKNEYQTKSADFQNMDNERKSKQAEIRALYLKIEEADQARIQEKEKLRYVKGKLRETVQLLDDMQVQDYENKRTIDDLHKRIDNLVEVNERLLTEKKQYELITQFVHRVTDESPISSEQLLSMLDAQE